MNGEEYYLDIEADRRPISFMINPSNIQLFRYSAITCNVHRIHFDKEYARQEGYSDVLVQSSLHIAFLTRLCTNWLGKMGVLLSIDVKVKRFALVGETLTCQGCIENITKNNDHYLIEMEVKELNGKREICAIGRAVMKLLS